MGEVKVTTWVQHPMDSHPFMSIHPLIPMIELFRNLTFKIQGQSHSSRSHNMNTILSPHIPFIPCWSALLFLRCSYLKNWPSKFKVKVMVDVKVQSQCESNILLTHIPFVPCQSGIPLLSYDFQNLTLKFKGQGHKWGHSSKSQWGSNILSTHIPFVPCQSGIPFVSYDFFKMWPWKSKVKVMGEVTVQSHNVGLAPYRITSFSFHVNRPSHSWDTAFSKFDLGNQGSRSWVRSQFKVTTWV